MAINPTERDDPEDAPTEIEELEEKILTLRGELEHAQKFRQAAESELERVMGHVRAADRGFADMRMIVGLLASHPELLKPEAAGTLRQLYPGIARQLAAALENDIPF